jgi:GntR family transcriptional regulator
MGKRSEHSAAYAAIYNALRKQIFNGSLSPGDLLPSESQLCAEYNVSRETVRKGLKELDSEGLIFSRPKVGYFVSTPNHEDVVLHVSDMPEHTTTQYCDIHGILPDEELQKILNIPGDRKVIELSQLTRDAAGVPQMYHVKYVPYERAYPSVESEMRYAVLPEITFSKVASYEYYTEVSISAVPASGKVAQMLECPEGEALLLVEQVFIRQDGTHIGYSRHYSRLPYGKLSGTSGHKI